MAHMVSNWRTSSFSAGANCVGLREHAGGGVQMCNTKRPEAGVLTVDRGALAGLVAACKDGELDGLQG